MYADDVVMGCSDKVTKEITEIFEMTCIDYGMVVNKQKSGIMRIKDNRSVIGVSEINNYPNVKSYKYLGIWVNYLGNIKEHL